MKKGKFITVEGMDGSGKTTQINLIEKYLCEKGFSIVIVREPGGTDISEKIRDIILDAENTAMDKITEMLLYASARAQLVSEVIIPALGEGRTVICGQVYKLSYVYQGFGRGIDFNIIKDVNKVALQGLEPDITFFFDIKPDEALKRKFKTAKADRIENESINFHKRVYMGYQNLAALFPHRIKTIDGNRGVSDVFEDVRKFFDELFGL